MKIFVVSTLFILTAANVYADVPMSQTKTAIHSAVASATTQVATATKKEMMRKVESVKKEMKTESTPSSPLTSNHHKKGQIAKEMNPKSGGIAPVAIAVAPAQEMNTSQTTKPIPQSTNPKKSTTKETAPNHKNIEHKASTTEPSNIDSEHHNGVVIQVGAFRTDALAETQAAKVSLLGVPSRVVKVTDAQGNTMRVVRSRHRMNQVEAEKAVGRLRQNDVPVLLLSN